MKTKKKKEVRDLRVSARISSSLYEKVLKVAAQRKRTFSDCVEEALIALAR